MIRAVIFDVDDTLVDTFKVGWRKFRTISDVMQIRLPEIDQFRRIYGVLGFDSCVDQLFGKGNAAEARRLYEKLSHYSPILLGDVQSALAAMEGLGLKLAVLTNGTRKKTRRKLHAVMPVQRWTAIRCGDEGLPKPDPGSYLRLVAELEVQPHETCFVGDSDQELSIAASLGMLTIGVSGGSREPFFHRPPHAVMPTIERLPGFLQHVTARDLRRSTGGEIVTFDAGGTLIEHRRSLEGVVVDVLRIEGTRHVVEDEVCRAIQAQSGVLDTPDLWRKQSRTNDILISLYSSLLRSLGSQTPGSSAAEVLSRYTSSSNWKKTADADGMLAHVSSAGYRVAVVSNWQANLRTCLDDAGLDSAQFSAIVASTEVGYAKPDSEIFQSARTSDERIAFHVGDSTVPDGVGALRAGSCAILVDRDTALSTVSRVVF